ncbi:MAG: SPOR domain-containing protein [Ignavibacteria bacterium]|nr:SPOR domain-containing protein [Ignavibacteria bacterium]
MRKFAKIYLLIFPVISALSLIACSSGEYEVTSYKVDYVEKTVKIDTIKNITLNEDKIKQDKNDKDNIKDNTKDSYSYIIQIGAFSMQSNFENFLNRAKQVLGDEVYYEQSGNLFKIRIGRYGNRAEAIKFVEIARSKGFTDAFIVTKKN